MKKKINTIFAILCISMAGYSQGFTNTGNLQIHSGGNLSSSFNFTNSNTAVLLNNGSFYLRGNLTNNEPSMSAGAGILIIQGSSPQTIDGTAAMRVNNLTTDNTLGITLNNDLSVGGTHTFTSGLIHSSSTPNYLIYESGSSYSGSSDSRHVTGWVKKIGNTSFTFPVGSNTYLRTTDISNLSASSEFNCHYYAPTQNTTNLLLPLASVRPNEYWQIDRVSGGTAQVTINWENTKVPMNSVALSDIRVANYIIGNWTDVGGTGTGSIATTGSATSNIINSFGEFTLGYVVLLPLKLISFTGWRKMGVTYLNWVSDNEDGVSHFSVERSYDGNIFTLVGNVNARNSGNRELYNLNDPASFTGKAFYRLKSVDIDGKYTYSKIITVSEDNITDASLVVLNPVQHAITILNKSAIGGVYNYRLFTASGQQVQNGVINMASNGVGIINLQAYVSAGIYTLELVTGKVRSTRQILIER